jgi:hypothetical protein
MINLDVLNKLLRVVIATVESLDEEEVQQLLDGKAQLSIVSTVKKTAKHEAFEYDQDKILAQLNESRDRTKAREILSAIKGRDALASFARNLKVHVVKHDRREDVESKIIEFLIGGRLRSEAIRTLNLKGGSSDPV